MAMSAKTKRRITHAYCNENLRKHTLTHKMWPGKVLCYVSNRGYFKFKKVENA